jgi:tryptophan 2,3-dioxygenase
MAEREIEDGMKRDLAKEMTYSDYLQLDRLLDCQQPQSSPEHHDEMLFIIIHQTTELWFKLIVHELTNALARVHADDLSPAFKILARVKNIQRQLFDQWAVLATLTPSEYTEFRHRLGRSSGFQSIQYRQVEFMLGNKDARMVQYHAHDPAAMARLTEALHAPSIYDAFLMHLARMGHDLPAHAIDRDFSVRRDPDDAVVEVLRKIYASPQEHWNAYNMCEKLVDVEEHFSLWRFRHMKVVARIIGFKHGTGGSSGVPFLRQMVDHEFFPELWRVRTKL